MQAAVYNLVGSKETFFLDCSECSRLIILSFISFLHLKQKLMSALANGSVFSPVDCVASGVLEASKHKASLLAVCFITVAKAIFTPYWFCMGLRG